MKDRLFWENNDREHEGDIFKEYGDIGKSNETGDF